jgi:hypothetical protein
MLAARIFHTSLSAIPFNSHIVHEYENPTRRHRWECLNSGTRRGIGAVYLPRHAEAINENAEAGGPECLLVRQPNDPAIGQGLKDSLRTSGLIYRECDEKTLRSLIIAGRYVYARKLDVIE